MAWSMKTILEKGSDELKSVVKYILQGHPTGRPIKEDEEDEMVQTRQDLD